jgi:hypothetical protein
MTDYLSPMQAARALEVGTSTIHRWCDRGTLEHQCYEVGGRKMRRVARSSVDRIAAERGLTPPTAIAAGIYAPGAQVVPEPEREIPGENLLPAWDKEIKPTPPALPGRNLSVSEAAELLLWAIVRRFTR